MGQVEYYQFRQKITSYTAPDSWKMEIIAVGQ